MAFQPFSTRGVARRVSDNDRRLTGNYDIPPDRVFAPDSGSYFRASRTSTTEPRSGRATEHSEQPRYQPSADDHVVYGKPSRPYSPVGAMTGIKRPAIPPKDLSLSSFRLDTFARVGRRNFPTIYEEIAARSSYTIAPKTYRSHVGLQRGVPMLQVGALSDTPSTLVVWVRSNGEDIEYYSGRELSGIVTELQKNSVSQIRYAKPFGDLASSEGAIQAFTHFLFLNFGMIDKLAARNDVILQFKEACRIFETHQPEAKEAMSDEIKNESKNVGNHVSSIGQDIPEEETKPIQSASGPGDVDAESDHNLVRSSDRAAERPPSHNETSVSSSRAQAESASDLTPRASSKSRVPSLFDHIKTFEDQLRAELAKDKASLEEEVQTLKKQLEVQKEQANNAKFRLDDERETREVAQENLKNAQEKMREQEQFRSRLEDERDALEAKSRDWENKYAGLKRKLRMLAEDGDEPAEKMAKH